MLSNFNFGVGSGYQCTPNINFNFTNSGITTSGFEFKSYDAKFPSEYYTDSYEFLFGETAYSVYHILPGSGVEFTAIAAGVDFFVTSTSGTEYEVKPSIPEVLNYSCFSPNINDIALVNF